MGWSFPKLFGRPGASTPRSSAPRAAAGDGGFEIDLSNPEHIRFLREGGGVSASGATVGVESAMRLGVAWRCIHIIAGACGNLPLDLNRRVSERVREPASDHALQAVLKRPNGWQTAQEFRKMLTAWKLLRGNGYGLKVTSRGRVIEIWPMHPDRVEPEQRADMSVVYHYTTKDGRRVTLQQDEVLHLRGLTLDGVKGLGVVQYAREAMGLAMQTEAAGARLFKHGVMVGGILKSPNALSQPAYDRLKADMDARHSGAENAHKWMILEEGLDAADLAMTAEDAQFLATRDFQRTDVGMFFGVPPHLYGAVDKSTSWGSGIEQQNSGFVQYTLDDHFVCWEQSCDRDLLTQADCDAGLYHRLERKALLRGDSKARQALYQSALQWGWMNPDEVRASEDMNPREDGQGAVYYDPPNTAGGEPKPDSDPDEDRTDDRQR